MLSLVLGIKQWFSKVVIWVSVSIGLLFLAYTKGRYAGSDSEKQKQKETLDKAREIRKEIESDVEKTPTSDLGKRASRWMRD